VGVYMCIREIGSMTLVRHAGKAENNGGLRWAMGRFVLEQLLEPRKLPQMQGAYEGARTGRRCWRQSADTGRGYLDMVRMVVKGKVGRSLHPENMAGWQRC